MKTLKFCICLSLAFFNSAFLFSQAHGISVLDVKTGIVTEVVNLGDSPAFNPTFSNNGKKIAFDTYEGYNGIYITDLQSGDSYPLEGALDCNDASWSPDGENIVFDRYGYEILYVPYGGGIPVFVVYGFDAEWNNTSEKIVYNEFGILKTVNIDGSGETTVSDFGSNPSWSPNGNHIAFSDGENLWVVDVDDNGNALGSPYQITFDGPVILNQQPTWSNNNKSLVFHSNRTTDNFDFDIWKVNIESGVISHVTGYPNTGDFDPSYSKNGNFIAFSTNANSIEVAPSPITSATARLFQNAPNPFKNSTEVTVEVLKGGHLQMLVYDQLGRLVTVLLNSEMEAGIHKVDWNPSSIAGSFTSGIYIIQMITSEGIQSKQMLYYSN